MCLKTATVLLAEDDPNDAFLVQRAFRKAELSHRLVHAADGQQAVDYLSGVPPFDDRLAHPFPNLLLLDLKMPRLNGFEVLEWLQGRAEFRSLPAIVLSSSDHQSDIEQARVLGAAEYYRKPGDPAELLGIIRALDERWLRTNHSLFRVEPLAQLSLPLVQGEPSVERA